MGVQRGRGNFKPRCPGRMDNWILILCRMSGKGEGIFLISFVWGGVWDRFWNDPAHWFTC